MKIYIKQRNIKFDELSKYLMSVLLITLFRIKYHKIRAAENVFCEAELVAMCRYSFRHILVVQ